MDASLNGDDEDDFMGLEEFDPTVELYECETDRWRYLSPLPNGAGRSQHAATSISDTKVSSESTKQMEQTLRAKIDIFFKSENEKNALNKK